MGVRKRGSAYYHYEFQYRGKTYRGVCEGCTTRQAALAFEKRVREQCVQLAAQRTPAALVENYKKELFGGRDITLDSAFAIFESKPGRRQCGEKQLAAKRTYWNDFCAFMHATHPEIVMLDKVGRSQAEEYISHLKKNGRFVSEISNGSKGSYKTQRALSNSTINVYHKVLRSVFARLKEDAGLLTNPFDFDMLERKSETREAFSLEELTLINENLTPFIRPLFLIGLYTGMSEGDICLLKWSEIKDGWIARQRKKTKVSLAIPMLQPLRKLIEAQRLISGNEEYVLPEHARMYLNNPSGISYRFKKFLRRLNIQNVAQSEGRSRAVSKKDVHSLRHTFAYLAGCCGIPLPIVQSILGHMSPEMTAHYQEHATRAEKERFLKQMGRALGTSIPSLETAESTLYEKVLTQLRGLSDAQLKLVSEYIGTLTGLPSPILQEEIPTTQRITLPVSEKFTS